MRRKPLPKVIRRTTEDLQRIVAGSEDEGVVKQRATIRHVVEAEPELTAAAIPPANDAGSKASMRSAWLAAKRRTFARKIVERHRTYAAVGGLVPIPIVNIGVITAIIMRMVKQLSELYDVPYSREQARSAVVGLISGAAPTGFGAVAASTAAVIVPGPGFVGLAVSALTAGALTQGIGLIFLEHFERESPAGSVFGR